jgi:glutamine phosphoribosylpyrophosphate amidotransferase
MKLFPRTRRHEMPAASLASGLRVKMSPSSPTTGLHALQHRGQESAGIAVSDGSRIVVHKEMGLVAQVFDEPSLTALRGDIAVAHCRYSTTGASVWANAQPTFRSTPVVRSRSGTTAT